MSVTVFELVWITSKFIFNHLWEWCLIWQTPSIQTTVLGLSFWLLVCANWYGSKIKIKFIVYRRIFSFQGVKEQQHTVSLKRQKQHFIAKAVRLRPQNLNKLMHTITRWVYNRFFYQYFNNSLIWNWVTTSSKARIQFTSVLKHIPLRWHTDLERTIRICLKNRFLCACVRQDCRTGPIERNWERTN